MSAICPKLKRGESVIETKRKHINQDLQDTIKRLKEDKNSLQDRVYAQRESNETTYAIKNWSRIIMM